YQDLDASSELTLRVLAALETKPVEGPEQVAVLMQARERAKGAGSGPTPSLGRAERRPSLGGREERRLITRFLSSTIWASPPRTRKRCSRSSGRWGRRRRRSRAQGSGWRCRGSSSSCTAERSG